MEEEKKQRSRNKRYTLKNRGDTLKTGRDRVEEAQEAREAMKGEKS